MTLLGSLIDKTTGFSLAGQNFVTIQHSLGTTPDEVRYAMRSVGGATVPSIAMGFGGNASLSTAYAPSVLGAAVVFGDIFSQYYHSIIR